MSDKPFLPEIAARVYRGSTAEAEHYASIAVVGPDNRLTHFLGDPSMVTMTRSSIKPFQLIPLVSSGAADKFQFEDRELAIMCGSHNGSDSHREVVASILTKADNAPDDLQCGTHWPMEMQQAKQYPLNGEDNDPLRHNCSGKHSGFLALARSLGEDVSRYIDPQSLTQTLVKQAVADYCEYPVEKMETTVDGCSAPNFSLPLVNLAVGFRKLASAEGESDEVRRAMARIRQAMWRYPEMVSGEGRFDLDLARSFPDNGVCKVGAEAVEGMGFADPPVGIAVKIHDGSWRALWPVCVEVLRQVGLIGDLTDYPILQRHVEPQILNYRNIITGSIRCEFSLHSA